MQPIIHTTSAPLLKRVRLQQLCLLLSCLLLTVTAQAQVNAITINLGGVDGLELTPDNIFNYQIQSTAARSTQVTVQGQVRFKAHPELAFSYTFPCTIRPGINQLSAATIHPQWTFTSGAMRDLFLNYKKLPEGTYQYCVSLTIPGGGGETNTTDYQECLYGKEDDLFLINLVTPEDNAKITEYNPMLGWVVNYPFASELSYKLRLVEIKDGQNTVNAVTRNNPIYTESNLQQTSQVYPVYAKQLQPWQPYGWTVDAYFKGILLGGAQPWKFIIIQDSILNALPHASLFVDIRNEKNNAAYYAVGDIKLKYVLDEKPAEVINISMSGEDGKPVKLKTVQLNAVLGDNRFTIDLKNEAALKHLGKYVLHVTNTSGQSFQLPFLYINPDFLK